MLLSQLRQAEQQMDKVIHIVCSEVKVPPAAVMRNNDRHRTLCTARQLCWKAIRENMQINQVDIAMHFGGYDHSTIVYGIKRINDYIYTEPELAQTYQRITAKL